MKTQKKYKNSFFDKNYFIFLFKQVWRNPFTHIFSTLYFLLLLLYSLVLPLITKDSPITTFSVPLTSLFLVFLSAIVFTFISILIFRAPIDDGTEILIVTKPLSRFEILVVKVVVYILYVVIIGTFGSILTTIIYVHPFSYYEDNIKIIFGTFIGTLTCGLLFGGLTTIVATFFRKTVVMLISVSIVVFFMLYSLLSVFVISNPLKVLSKQGTSLLPISLIKYDEKSKSSGLVQGAMSTPNTSPQKLWDDAKKKTNYVQSSMFDFGSQLSSLFTLAVPPSDYMQAIKNISSFNKPIDFVFDNEYDLNNDIKSRFTISAYDKSKIPSGSEWNELKDILEKIESSPEFLQLKKSISFVGLKKDNSSLRTNSKNGVFSQRNYEIGDFTRRNLNSELWDNYWKKYGDKVTNEMYDQMWYYHETIANKLIPSNSTDNNLLQLANNFKYEYRGKTNNIDKNDIPPKYSQRTSISDPASLLLREIYIEEVQKNRKSVSWFIDTINEMIMSGLYKYSTQNDDILMHMLFNPLTDFDYNVKVKDIFVNIDTSDQTTSEIIDAIKKILGNNVSITKETYVYEIISYIHKNKKEWVNEIDKDNKKRNEMKVFMNLFGFKVQPIIYSYESDIKKILSENSYYIKQMKNVSFTLKNSKIISDEEKIEKYYFSSAYTLSPIDLLIRNKFKPATVKSELDRNLLIPLWILVSLVLFIIGSTIYYKKDFA